MSAVNHHSPTTQRQWWPRITSRSSTISSRPPKSPPTTIPRPLSKSVPALDEKKSLRPPNSPSKSTFRFNTIASAMGFRSKKSHHSTLPPLDPPPLSPTRPTPHIRTRAQTMDNNASTLRQKSSISTTLSSEDPLEPITPSDLTPRIAHSIPLDFDPFAAAVRKDTNSSIAALSTDQPKLALISDPSVHVKIEASSAMNMRYSQAVSSSYSRRPTPEHKPASSMTASSYSDNDSAQSAITRSESLRPKTSDSSVSNTLESIIESPRSSTPVVTAHSSDNHPEPDVLDVSTALSMLGRGNVAFDGKGKGSARHFEIRQDEDTHSQIALEVNQINLNDTPPSSAKLNHGLVPKSSAKSFSSAPTLSNQSSYSSLSGKFPPLALTPTSPSSTTSLRHKASSSSRLRSLGTLPPTPAPAPTHDLPPTPRSPGTPALTPHSPKSSSSTSLHVSPLSPPVDAQSLLSYDLPPGSPVSENESSSSLSFAKARPRGDSQSSAASSSSRIGVGPSDWRNPRLISSINSPSYSRITPYTNRHLAKAAHAAQPSVTSTVSSARGPSHNPRSLKKSVSQQSLNSLTRADSIMSAGSLFSEESIVPGGIGKTLRKQRSLHNARAGLLPTAPWPQPLRHANSFTPPATMSSTSTKVNATGSSSRRAGSSHSNSNSAAVTPTTPSKKRALFPHSLTHAQDEREREREWLNIPSDVISSAEKGGKKEKGNSARSSGLGLSLGLGFPSFTNPFHSSSSVHDEPLTMTPPQSPPHSPASFWEQQSAPPVPVPESPGRLGGHILPPAELLSRIEALSDTQLPPSPPQFAQNGDTEPDDEWGLDGVSSEPSPSSDTPSFTKPTPSDRSPPSRKSDHTSSKATSTHHFMSPSGSIHERLQSVVPSPTSPTSTPSRLPIRSTPNLNSRPATAASSSARKTPSSTRPPSIRSSSGSGSGSGSSRPSPTTPPPRSPYSQSDSGGEQPVTGLPPPPRRPGSAVTQRYSRASEVPIQPLSPPPSRHRRPSRMTSKDSFKRHGSLMRKSSFLNIEDDADGDVGVPSSPLGSVGGDAMAESFLELERGKDSLDIIRISEDGAGVW